MMKVPGSARLLAIASIAAFLAMTIVGARDGGSKRLSFGELASLRGAGQFLYILSQQSCNSANSDSANGTKIPGVPGSGGTIKYYGSDTCSKNLNKSCIFCGDNTAMPQPTGPTNYSLSSSSGTNGGNVDTTSVSCGRLSYGTCVKLDDGTFECSITGPDAASCANAQQTKKQSCTPAASSSHGVEPDCAGDPVDP